MAKSISITGDAIAALEGDGFDFVGQGFARIFDPHTGAVSEWLREPGLSDEDVRQMDAIYRAGFPTGPTA